MHKINRLSGRYWRDEFDIEPEYFMDCRNEFNGGHFPNDIK
jgi:hypothetical protein